MGPRVSNRLVVPELPPNPPGLPPHVTNAPQGERPPVTSSGVRGTQVASAGFFSRHATGLTVLIVGTFIIGLGVAPVPDRYKILKLSNFVELKAISKRVLRKPKLTFASRDKPAILQGDGDEKAPVLAPEASALDAPLLTATLPKLVPSTLADEKRARVEPPQTGRALALRRLAVQLKAEGTTVDNPCIKKGPTGGCDKTALDNFFAALDAVAQKRSGAAATVVTLGNSLIASDHVTDIARERLVEEFGSAGRGYLLPDRLSKLGGRRVRTGRGTPGWIIHTFAQKKQKRSDFGFAGSMHESSVKGDRIRWRTDGARRVEVFWLDHKRAAPFVVSAVTKRGKQRIMRVQPERPGAPDDKVLELELPDDAKQLVVTAEGKGVVLYGAALSNEVPGVTWDTIGVPASDAAMYMGVEEARFKRQLKARDPALVVAMIGGNETRSLAFKWTNLDEVRGHYAALLDRIKAAAPDASCLAVAPIDAAKATSAGATLTTRPQLVQVVEMEREVAREKGCGFLNLFEAMGGRGSLQRFHRRGLINDDLVHPKGKGGDVMGQLLADALLDSYRKTPAPKAPVKIKTKLVRPKLVALESRSSRPERELASFYRALARDDERIAVGFFGDTHVSAQQLTDRVRERMQVQFGSAGRGFIEVGRATPQLLPSRVTRKLQGAFEVADGREVRSGGAVSVTGSRVRLLPGGRTQVTFCDGCQGADKVGPRAPRGFIELSWLFTPDMGAADVYVNNVLLGALDARTRSSRRSDVQFMKVPVRGEAHTVSVQARQGPVNLLGVASEVERGGVIVDALGNAGSTAMTLQRWRKDLIQAQVAKRQYDLVVTVWGTEEAALGKLDGRSYKHHAKKTLGTLLSASPAASCVVVGPPPRAIPDASVKGGFRPAPKVKLVDKSLRTLASESGCAYFSLRAAMGDRQWGRWVKDGLALDDGKYLSSEGYERLGDLFVNEVVGLFSYLQKKRAQDLLKRAVAKGGNE